jgi:small GTP-binding protein
MNTTDFILRPAPTNLSQTVSAQDHLQQQSAGKICMADHFNYDVFLSHSAKDKAIVRPLAERLRADGLRVWFDEWVIKPGDSIPAKIEDGLEQSRVLVLCMSAQAFGSDWARLESYTFRFRDPLNQARRFLPLRLDDAELKGLLAQFSYINWLPEAREQEYSKLLDACRSPAKPTLAEVGTTRVQVAEKVLQLDYTEEVNDDEDEANAQLDYTEEVNDDDEEDGVHAYAFSMNGKHVLTGVGNTVQLLDIETGHCLRVLKGHSDQIWSIAWSPDHRYAISGGKSEDKKEDVMRLWDLEKGKCLRVFEAYQPSTAVWSVAWSSDQRFAISGAYDKTVRLWDVETGRCLRVFEGHTDSVRGVSWSRDQRRILSGASDNTVRLWDVETGRCLHIFEGHTGDVWSVAWSDDQYHVLSASFDNTVRLWSAETGRCLCVLDGHTSKVNSVAWSADQRHAFSGDRKGGIRVWDLSEFITEGRTQKVIVLPEPNQVQYTNAKVLLVGESGAGKTGLSQRLVSNDWEPSDSTVGAWATQWKLPVDSDDGVEREIWLWDFGGQADQRLIHQLYMDETALAALVFDGQREDLFETLGQWDRDLTRAARQPFTKLLVAGRTDAGGLRVSRSQVEAFAQERGYAQFLETSAKQNIRCEELRQAILDGIRWENIPWRSSPLLFKRLKEEIIRLKDEGRVLMRFNELRETLMLRLAGGTGSQPVSSHDEPGQVENLSHLNRFTDAELKAVVSLLAGPGVVWELKFGSWVLLQPERINAYAQAVIQTMREDQHERGCLLEEPVLQGALKYHSSMARLDADEERFVLLAMHQTLVERGLCLRQPTEKGNLLIFPSYYRRERPEQVSAPRVLVSYHFSGFLDELYATLVVRLHHTEAFEQDQLWRYAADFKTHIGKQLGVKLTRRSPGEGELEVYFDPTVAMEEKIIFSKYVHEHLLQHAQEVERLRHYICPHCGTSVGNREVAMKRLNGWLQHRPAEPDATGWLKFRKAKTDAPTIICSECEKRVPLWDELEQCFASPEIQQRVRDMQEESTIVLDNESKERALVGEVISTVSLAGQIIRELTMSDHGIDMEIEFKSDAGEATGRKLYLQLKSGDSYLKPRKRDSAEVFTIKEERHVRYWMAQAFPVLLVVRNSEGEVRWMEVRDYLKRESDDGKKAVKQIVFSGERFDVMSVRRWRDAALRG